jgi:hypothetical protein
MATIYYDILLPDDTGNVELSSYIRPCTNKSSPWWNSLDLYVGGAKDLAGWFNQSIRRGGDVWRTSTPYTIKVCPGIGDLFKVSSLVVWPCDCILSITGSDRDNFTFYYKNANIDGQVSLVSFYSHPPSQWESKFSDVYHGMVNLKMELPLMLWSPNPSPIMLVSPDYHLNYVPYSIMPGIVTPKHNQPYHLNINTMFPLPEPGETTTYEFKQGTPICYMTFMNGKKVPTFKPKKPKKYIRKKFLRGNY